MRTNPKFQKASRMSEFLGNRAYQLSNTCQMSTTKKEKGLLRQGSKNTPAVKIHPFAPVLHEIGVL